MRRHIRTLFAGGILACALFGAAMAGTVEDGRIAYQRGDYAAAMQILRPLAEQGNARAQLGLGLMYGQGQGVPQDYAQAVIWYSKAAYQGDADLQTALGGMYASGLGVPQDDGQSAAWFQMAANQGQTMAQGALGLRYVAGKGVPRDYILAYMWLNLAAAHETYAPYREMDAKMRDLIFPPLITPDQIAEAQRMAREWRPK